MKVLCADLFCGAGGTSNGLVEAASELGIGCHQPLADCNRNTHGESSPGETHLCARGGDSAIRGCTARSFASVGSFPGMYVPLGCSRRQAN